MASVTSNLDAEIAPTLKGLSRLLVLSRPHRGKRLGDHMADIVATGIQARTLDDQKTSEGAPLAANRGYYGARKRTRGILVGVGLYGSTAKGVSTGGDMLSFDQLRGRVAIGDDTVVMTAGLDDEAEAKVAMFSEGDATKNQPPRPFYELDETIESNLDQLLDEAIEAGIRDLGGV